MSRMVLTERKLGTRAVLRRVDPGSAVSCSGCGEYVKFAARDARMQVIANVYVGERWDRVEHFHHECYTAAGEPYGTPTD